MEVIESVKTHQLEESSSYTRPDDQVREDSFSHRWTIEDFSVMLAATSSKCPKFKSTFFSSPVNPDMQFIIDLRPKGDIEESKDYLSIFLELVSPQKNEILVRSLFYLVNSKGEKYRKTLITASSIYSPNTYTSWGLSKFVLRSELLDSANDLLNDDRLTIICEVTVFDGTLTVDTGKYMPTVEEMNMLSKKQILVDLNSLFEQEKQSDVTVVWIGDKIFEISAHNFVLVGGSSVFEAMFKYETNEKLLRETSLSDVSVEVGELFIRYLYSGKVAQLETYAEELFVVADKYDIDLLKRMCVQCLCSQMSTSSVCHLLLLSDRHSSTELQLTCIEYITNHANEVIRNQDWTMMSQLNDTLKVELFRKLANKLCIDSKAIMDSDSAAECDSDSSNCLLSSTPKISKMEPTECVKIQQLNETYSYTCPSNYTFSHRWTIEDFSVMFSGKSSEDEYSKFKSALFSFPANPAIQFAIQLCPKGDTEDTKDYLSLYLELASIQENEILVNSIFYLINSKGEKCYESEDDGPDIFYSNDTWGWGKFLLHSELLDPANDLLNEDRLTILCVVTVFDTFTLNSAKYIPSLEEVKVTSKKQILMELNCGLECDKQTDVTLVVGNGAKEIRAHKFVLVGASSVFEAMFENDATEDVVSLSDVSVEGGELFIRYLYTGNVAQLETYAEELFVVADKYGTDLLKRMCVQCLCSQMSTSSVCQLLLLSDRHSSTKLQQSCIEYITNHANEVILNKDWQMMSQLDDTLKVELFCKLANKPCIVSKAIMSPHSAECDSDCLLSCIPHFSKMEVTESVNMQQLKETFSYTYPSKYTFSHQWTIEDFSVILSDTSSECPIIKSASFPSAVNSAIQFAIQLYPKGNSDDTKDYLSLFLELVSPQENEVLVHRSVYLVNSKGEKYGETDGSRLRIFSSENTSSGWDKFLLRSDLMDPVNDLLNKDKLTILCEVTIFGAFAINSAKYIPSLEEVKVLSKKQILVDLNCVLECDKQTDVTLVVGNGAKEIRAHKFVLVGASSVFEAMFKYDTSEKQSGVVTLTDVSAEVGELFIQYLYSGEMNQLEMYAEELFVVADIYLIDLLKRMCVQCLCSQMSTSSVCQLLLLSDRHSSTELQHVCIEYIIKHALEVIHNEDWQMMSQLNDQLMVELFSKLAKIYSDFNDCIVSNAPQIEETSSNTRPVKHSFSHKWVIEDFSVMLADTSSEYPKFKSASFSSAFNSAIQFAIKFYPKGNNDNTQDYLSLFVELVSRQDNEVLVHYSFYLVNSKGEKYEETVSSKPEIFSSNDAWGYDEFVLRSDLLAPANDLLNEDRLTIICEVTVFDGTFTVDTGKYMPSVEEVKVLSKKQTLVNLTSLLECDKQTDVTVVVGGADGAKEIKAHKFVLIGGSSVFKEMFENNATEDVVSLSDVSIEGGELFIRYFYSGKVNQLKMYAKELFVVADKYNIDLLKRMCVQSLCSQVNTEAVFKLLIFADRHSSTELQQSCIEYITNHANEVIRTDHWQMMSQLDDQLKALLFHELANKH